MQFFTNNSNPQVTLLQNGNVGIGDTSPTEKLDVIGSVLTEGSLAGFRFNDRADNAKGYLWYSTGGNAHLYRIQAPTGNVISLTESGNIGFKTSAPQSDLHINPAGSGSILIGTNKNTGGFTNLEMGISAQSGGQSFIQSTKASGSTYGTLQLNPAGSDVAIAGHLGIGTNTPFYPLDIKSPGNGIPSIRILETGHIWELNIAGGNLFFTHNNGQTLTWIDYTDGSVHSASDKRLKKNIEEINPVLNKVLQLKAKNYQFIGDEEASKKSTGFIAQEVMELFPELVGGFKRNGADSTQYYGINYAGFSVVAIKAIQEQQVITESQQKSIDKLTAQNQMILDEFEKLKASIYAIQINK